MQFGDLRVPSQSQMTSSVLNLTIGIFQILRKRLELELIHSGWSMQDTRSPIISRARVCSSKILEYAWRTTPSRPRVFHTITLLRSGIGWALGFFFFRGGEKTCLPSNDKFVVNSSTRWSIKRGFLMNVNEKWRIIIYSSQETARFWKTEILHARAFKHFIVPRRRFCISRLFLGCNRAKLLLS